MSTYLINHLRIPYGLPKPDNLKYLEQVEATFEPFGGKWLVLDAQVEVLEGQWPGSVVLMEFPDMDTARRWYESPEYQEILHLEDRQRDQRPDPGRPGRSRLHLGRGGRARSAPRSPPAPTAAADPGRAVAKRQTLAASGATGIGSPGGPGDTRSRRR